MYMTKKTQFLILRVTQELKDKLLKKSNGKKLSAFVRELIEKALG